MLLIICDMNAVKCTHELEINIHSRCILASSYSKLKAGPGSNTIWLRKNTQAANSGLKKKITFSCLTSLDSYSNFAVLK